MIVYLPTEASNITLSVIFPVLSLHSRLTPVIISVLSYDIAKCIETALPDPVLGIPRTIYPAGESVMEIKLI